MNLRKPLCTALVVLGTLLAVAPAQAQLGIAAGLNFDEFSDIDYRDRDGTVENSTGYHIGLFYDLAFGGLAIRPGVFYRDLGDVEYAFSGVNETFSLNLIEVPIDLRFRLPLPLVAPYAMAGPVFSFASSDDEGFNDRLKDLSVAANVGAGIELGLGGLRLFPEVRYAFGVTGFFDEEAFQVGGVSITPEEQQRLNAFMLRLGIAF